MGKPFLQLPGKPPQDKVLFHASDGTPITVEAVEMVYNDMLLMDAIYGNDGPFYQPTCDARHREILRYAIEAYGGATWDPAHPHRFRGDLT